MNTPNPLLPQGALPPAGRSSLYFKILIILAVHVVVLGAFLMSACKPTAQTSSTPKDIADIGSGAATTPDPYTTPAAPVPLPSVGGGQTTPIAPQQQAQTPPVVSMGGPTPVPPVPAIPSQTTTTTARDATEYTIASGDTMDALHKKFNVPVKAIEDANPGLDPKKMQIGSKLHIPASTVAAPAPAPAIAGGVSGGPAASGDTTTYVIKAGDVLSKIAKAHNTTVPAIEALNGMKTSAIQAGKTIKLPVMRVASVVAAPGSAGGPVIPAAPATPATPVRAN